MQDNELALIYEYFSLLERQGPGSMESTLMALDLIGCQNGPDPNPLARIADLGCGTGSATLVLSHNQPGALITAIDKCPAFIDILRKKIEDANRWGITPLTGDMATPPLADGQTDIIWSEGAIYNIGFERGLRDWRRYLRDGGFVAVTELSWLTEERPAEIDRYWTEAYPDIDTIPHKVEQLQRAGYRLAAAFPLSVGSWTTNYYEPQRQAQDIFLRRHPGDPAAQRLVDAQRHEAALYSRYGSYYGYVFYIGKKV